MNLIDDKWIPVMRKDGKKDTIRPSEIVSNYTTNPIIGFDVPRADFNGALYQFFIGLAQTAWVDEFAENEDNWLDHLHQTVPSESDLYDLLKKFIHCFEADGNSWRFMQDKDIKPKSNDKCKPIYSLLIEAPGENTIKENIDLFVKRRKIQGMSKEMAVLALLTLQINAPAGGPGYRTSLRGGGPLTTIIVGNTIWESIWLNVLPSGTFDTYIQDSDKDTEGDMFPWMRKTKISDVENSSTTPQDAHPLTMYWGMPWRVFLCTESTTAGMCDLTGREVPTLVKHYEKINYGNDYKGGWLHPLSPFNVGKNDEKTAEHGQPGGVRYKNWLGFIQEKFKKDKKNKTLTVLKSPAHVISYFRKIRVHNIHSEDIRFRVWAFGYDMDNMKARSWHEGIMPLIPVRPECIEQFDHCAQQYIEAADSAASMLRSAYKDSLRNRPQDIDTDTTLLVNILDQFWWQTERAFYTSLEKLKSLVETTPDDEEKKEALKKEWLEIIQKTALSVFDSTVKSSSIEDGDIKRIVKAENTLRMMLYSDMLKKILEMKIDSKVEKEAKRATKKKK